MSDEPIKEKEMVIKHVYQLPERTDIENLRSVSFGTLHANVTLLSSFEEDTMRSLIEKSLNLLDRIKKKENNDDRG